MDCKTENEELKKRIRRLESESFQRKRFEGINHALFKISSAINTTANLDQLYESIHRALNDVVDTTNFYIALYDPVDDCVSFPYCVDEVDECYPPVIGISKTASLTAEVIRTGQPLLINKAEIKSQREKSGYSVPACSLSEIWLGVPLKTINGTVGVMAAQSYTDPARYDQTDMDVMVSVADQVASAIEYKRADEERNQLIKDLQNALDEIKTLQGILPICSNCKNIRDDKGSWSQIEAYIQNHSGAKFSHGICPQCAEELYPDMKLYDD